MARASSSNRAMRATVLSLATRVTSIVKLPSPQSEPPNTFEPADFSTGMPSPVTSDSSTLDAPATTLPSVGNRSPGLTSTRSPASNCSIATSCVVRPSGSSRRARHGVNSTSDSNARCARRWLTCSIHSERRNSTTSDAASRCSPVARAPSVASTTSTCISSCLRRTACQARVTRRGSPSSTTSREPASTSVAQPADGSVPRNRVTQPPIAITSTTNQTVVATRKSGDSRTRVRPASHQLDSSRVRTDSTRRPMWTTR